MMDELTIKNELVKFDVVEAGLVELESRYMIMKVAGVDDTEGCAMVHKARMDVKGRRVDIVKNGEEMRKDAVAWQKKVLARVNRIVLRCEGMENHLQEQENIVENEKVRIKGEADAKEAARIQVRIDAICAFGASFNGQMYVAYGLQIPVAIVKVCNDEQFDLFVAQVQEKKDGEDARLKAEEAARLEEQALILKVQQEQETERQRLAEIARTQTEEADRLKAEQKKIDDAKQKVIDDAKRAEEVEVIRKAAIEQARIDVEAKIKRQIEEKAAAELRAKIAAEKKAARQPDKIKLLRFADELAAIVNPELKTPEGEAILTEANFELVRIIKILRDKTEAL